MKVVDEAKDNPRTRQLIESSWLLQDRLVFEGQVGKFTCVRFTKIDTLLQPEISKPVILRFLGHALLCGVLHVAYNTNDRVEGQYLICLLYRSSLVLAVPTKGFGTYKVVAVIALLNGAVEACDNGRGEHYYYRGNHSIRSSLQDCNATQRRTLSSWSSSSIAGTTRLS